MNRRDAENAEEIHVVTHAGNYAAGNSGNEDNCIGFCYGYSPLHAAERRIALAILAAGGANSVAEKASALRSVRTIEENLLTQAWSAAAKDAVGQMAVRRGGFVIGRLARQLGMNLVRRKLLQVVPLIGAVGGGAANAVFLGDIGWAARRVYQERWLIDNRKALRVVRQRRRIS